MEGKTTEKNRLALRLVFNGKNIKRERFELLPVITIYKYAGALDIEIGLFIWVFEVVLLWKRKLKS